MGVVSAQENFREADDAVRDDMRYARTAGRDLMRQNKGKKP